MNHGRCIGGPWDGKPLAHAGSVYLVALDRAVKKAIPGMFRATHPSQDVHFGEYRWDLAVWRWHDPESCEQPKQQVTPATQGR